MSRTNDPTEGFCAREERRSCIFNCVRGRPGRRDVSEKTKDYMGGWGLYVKVGLEDSKAALLVVVGALKDGRKVVLAVDSGQRESKESWARVLRDLRARGLRPWRATEWL